jgi:hypothetical protein
MGICTFGTLEGEISCIPDIGIVTSNGNNPNPKHQRNKYVENCPRRNKQRRADIGYLTPWSLVSAPLERPAEPGYSQSNVIGNKPIPELIPKI